MASLQELKGRISSVSTTKKITKAMQLVATAKLQKARKNLNSIQEYYSSVYDMFQDLLANVKDIKSLVPEKSEDSDIYIIITSDIGLCGGYNSNIFKLLKTTIRPQDKLVVIGNQGITWSASNEFEIVAQFGNVGDEPHYALVAEISKEVLPRFFAGQARHVNIVHTKFINTVTTEAKLTRLLPIEKPEDTTSKIVASFKGLTEFEPSPEVVLKNAIPLYISALIYGAQVESKVSEMSSRRNAMENASDNADELISTLDLEYNRLRQATITQEISEIVAGAETE